jgi:hypothetical protein
VPEPDADLTSDLTADLGREVERVADRLRTLSLARLAEPVRGHASRAAAGRTAAQAMADTCAAIEGRRAQPLPALADGAVGDQVAVTGADLLAAARAADRRGAVTDALELLVAVRRAL